MAHENAWSTKRPRCPLSDATRLSRLPAGGRSIRERISCSALLWGDQFIDRAIGFLNDGHEWIRVYGMNPALVRRRTYGHAFDFVVGSHYGGINMRGKPGEIGSK